MGPKPMTALTKDIEIATILQRRTALTTQPSLLCWSVRHYKNSGIIRMLICSAPPLASFLTDIFACFITTVIMERMSSEEHQFSETQFKHWWNIPSFTSVQYIIQLKWRQSTENMIKISQLAISHLAIEGKEQHTPC